MSVITYGVGVSSFLREAALLDAALRLALADRYTIRNSGAVIDRGSVNGSGSDTSRMVRVGLDGSDSMSFTATEDEDILSTDVTTDHADITVARAGIRRDPTDFFILTGKDGLKLDYRRLAQSMVGEFDALWMATLATAIATATQDVGQSGVDMSMDDQYDAIFAMELGSVPGPFFEMLHARQYADWQGDMRGETGPLQWIPATIEQLKLKDPGYKGEFMGAQVHVSSKVTASGGNRNGALWGLEALSWKHGTMEAPPGATLVRPDSMVAVEFQRDASKALTEIVGHAYFGMSVEEQARIVGIVTDQ